MSEEGSGPLSLEGVLSETGQTRRLALLMEKRSRNLKGCSADEILSSVIHPLLDDLECCIREKTDVGCSKEELEQIITEWIDARMAEE